MLIIEEDIIKDDIKIGYKSVSNIIMSESFEDGITVSFVILKDGRIGFVIKNWYTSNSKLYTVA